MLTPYPDDIIFEQVNEIAMKAYFETLFLGGIFFCQVRLMFFCVFDIVGTTVGQVSIAATDFNIFSGLKLVA